MHFEDENDEDISACWNNLDTFDEYRRDLEVEQIALPSLLRCYRHARTHTHTQLFGARLREVSLGKHALDVVVDVLPSSPSTSTSDDT